MIYELSGGDFNNFEFTIYTNKNSYSNEQPNEKLKDEYKLYLKYIKEISNLFDDKNLKNKIHNILLEKDKNISAYEAIEIIKLFFSTITYSELNEEIYNILYSDTQKKNIYNLKLNRSICSDLIYSYIFIWFSRILTANSNSIMENLKYWKENNFNPYSFCNKLLKYIPNILIINEAIQYLFNYEDTENKDISDETLENLLKISIKIYNSSSIKDIKYKNVYHYTSLYSIYNMLSKSNTADFNNNPAIFLHMSNVVYLNDPKEGILYKDIINKNFGNKINNNTKYVNNKNNEVITRNTYILCFSKDEQERLPMWIQYGDNAKGCRIEFEVPDEIQIRKINYKYKTDKIPNIINYLLNKYKNEKNSVIKKYINDKIIEIQYYYKNIYYKHEDEVRYTTITLPENALEYDFIREGEYFPRLYCKTPYPFKIKSVMLGPKCPNPEQVALYLKRMGVPEVLKSNIKFQ